MVNQMQIKEFGTLCTNKGIILCEKGEGAFLCLRCEEDLENLINLLSKIKADSSLGCAGTPLLNLELTVRTYNRLFDEGIKTIESLQQTPDAVLRRIPGLGKHSFNEVKEALKFYLSLQEPN